MWRRSCLILTVGMALDEPDCGRRGIRRGQSGLCGATRAGTRASKPFHSPRADLPKVLRQDNLDYDKYRRNPVPPRPGAVAADDLPFRVEFFHPGYLYQEPVHVNEFTPTHVQPIRFVQDFFNYGSLNIQNQIPVQHRLRRFPRAVSVERDEQVGRTRRVSRRELFPAARQGPALRPVRARAGAGLRRNRTGRRNFPSSPTGGSASRRRTTRI